MPICIYCEKEREMVEYRYDYAGNAAGVMCDWCWETSGLNPNQKEEATMKLIDVYESAFDSAADKEGFDLGSKAGVMSYVREYATGAFDTNLSDAEAIAITDAYLAWEGREWDPEYQRRYGELVVDPLDIEVGSLGCQYSDELGWHHPYTTFLCPELGCHRELCFSCGVRCTNDSTGEGWIECPCGHSAEYK